MSSCCGLFLLALKSGAGLPLPSADTLLGADAESDPAAESPPPQGFATSLRAQRHLDAKQLDARLGSWGGGGVGGSWIYPATTPPHPVDEVTASPSPSGLCFCRPNTEGLYSEGTQVS